MKRIPLLALVGLLALPVAGTLQAQQSTYKSQPHAQADSGRRGGPRAGMRGRMQGGFAARLLAQRSELKLTDRQVAQLTDIQKKYQERNSALMTRARGAGSSADRTAARERMQAERKATRERMQAEREEYLKSHPEVRQAMDQLRQNRQNEQKDVESVLTPEQRSQLEQRRERMGQFGPGGRGWSRDSAAAGRK